MTRDAQRHVLVTGGAGYIGSLLVGELLEAGCRVSVVDKLLFGDESLAAYRDTPDFHFAQADVTEAGALVDALDPAWTKPFAVVHLAALVGFPACAAAGREATWRQNVDATRLVYEGAATLGAEHFLFASTYSNYGLMSAGQPVTEESPLQPQSLYAESKIAAEELLLEKAGEACAPVIFRFATLFGVSPRTRFDLILNQFVLDAFRTGKLLLYQPEMRRSFVHVRDIVRGLQLALEAPPAALAGQIFNLGDESGNLSKRDLAALIQRHIPELAVEYRALEFEGDMRDITASFEKARRVLDFSPRYSVEDGVVEVLDALQNGRIPNPQDGRYRNAPVLVP